MFDVRPAGKFGGFGDLLKDKIEELELSLVEALLDDEAEIFGREQRKEKEKTKQENLIKNQAKSFRTINLDYSFSKEEPPIKIVSKIFSAQSQEELNWEIQRLERRKEEIIKRRVYENEVIELEERNRNQGEKNLDQKERIFLIKRKIKSEARRGKALNRAKKEELRKKARLIRKEDREEKLSQIKNNLISGSDRPREFVYFLKPALAFSSACLVIFLTIFSVRFISYGLQLKDQVIVKGVNVVSDLEKAKDSFQERDFAQIVSDFKNVQTEIDSINDALEKMEGGLPGIISRIPFLSKYGSTKNLLEAGEEIAKAMVLLSEAADEFSKIENPLNFEKQNSSLGEFFLSLEDKMSKSEEHFDLAAKKIELADEDDIPEEYRDQVIQLKQNFPQALTLLQEFNQKQVIFRDLLGFNGPRKYLFLFQNNHEIRATGGFIGSYGVLSVHDGNIKELFIDGIFNPDGQLSTWVVPPKPIQKISEAWSTHDANWFPDFPTSAKKIAWFYEKTGGPTVDGIITLTPTLMEKLLEITGPIEMPEYEVTVNADNFIEATQFEVEVDYDKEENRPKKFIADLTPKILNQVFAKENLNNFPKTLQILSEALNEKHILIYSENSEVQEMVSDLGWSGEVLEAPKDYLMVVNSNINGYKTDGVIDQKIDHQIEIESDGSIIDTVTIERTHNGGSSEYEWWNKVNADYMRVYVPFGSELLEADGYTRETVEPPVNYDKLEFKRDELVESIENSIKIDKESGTEIWEESGKTVFGNWVYVSPQETVKVVYKYKLPFKLDINQAENKMDNFSILYQKQSGMNTSELATKIELAADLNIFWHYPEALELKKGEVNFISNLEEDRFVGVVVE